MSGRTQFIAALVEQARDEESIVDPWEIADRVMELWKSSEPVGLGDAPDEDEIFAVAIALDDGRLETGESS